MALVRSSSWQKFNQLEAPIDNPIGHVILAFLARWLVRGEL